MSTSVDTDKKLEPKICKPKPEVCEPEPKICRVLSGGQTGSDRAALDAARALGIPYGGFIPKGRWSESGPLPEAYDGMWETDHGGDGNPTGLLIRTRLNARAADLTLIFEYGSQDSPGTNATALFAKEESRCVLVKPGEAPKDVWTKIKQKLPNQTRFTINIAGPRESEGSDVYERTSKFLFELLRPHAVWSGQTEADRHLAIGQAMDNLRHWDNIRWLAPFFFWTICGGVAFASQDIVNSGLSRIAFLVTALIGALCAYLMWRTYRFHKEQVQSLKNAGVDTSAFGLTKVNWWKSATLYFGLSVLVTSVTLLFMGLMGPKKLHEWVKQSSSLSWLLDDGLLAGTSSTLPNRVEDGSTE